MKWHLLTSLGVALFLTSATADEAAIVTGGTGYLLDNQGRVAETVPFYRVLEITGARGDLLQVRYDGRQLQIHKGQVHRTSQLSYVTDSSQPKVRRVFELLQQAAASAAEPDYDAALTHAQQARREAREAFDQATPLEPWVLQYEAWLHYAQQDYQTAAALLETCQTTLKELGQQQHLQAADVMNVRGLLSQVEGEYADAIAAFQQAAMIQISELGIDHQDTAIVHSNLSAACEEHGSTGQAVTAQKITVNTLASVLPESAEERAQASLRLGNLQRDAQEFEQALAPYREALRLYQTFHADQPTQAADLLVYIIYCTTENGDFEAAEQTCERLLAFSEDLSEENARYYRRDALTRQGIIDHRQEDLEAALVHYYEAFEQADPDNYHVDDANALENAGHALVSLDRTEKAKQEYEKAIRIYAITEGADSEVVLNLREQIDDVDSYRDNSLGGYVQVAMPRGYLLDDDGKVLAVVPGLSVLEWYSSSDESHEVRFNDQLGRMSNTQLLTRRLLPGYGVAQAPVYRRIMTHVADALQALSQQKKLVAEEQIYKGLQLCRDEYGDLNSLYYWLKLMQAGIELRAHGMAGADRILQQVDSVSESINPDSYPVRVDLQTAQAAVLRQRGEDAAAARLLADARDSAIERYGEQHIVVRELMRSLAKSMYRAGEHERAAAELRQALKIARETLPSGASEIPELVSELSLVLTESGEPAEAAQLLETILSGDDAFPRELHAMLVATLGSVYARLDRTEDAEELLSAVVDVLQNSSPEAINIPAGLLALTERGKLKLAEQNWKSAADDFERAIAVAGALQSASTFEAAELYRHLAESHHQLSQNEQAAIALKEVLRIYEFLGGASSPQADAIRAQLRLLMLETPVPENNASAHAELLARHFTLNPDHEQMLITTEGCAVRESAGEQAGEIATLDSGSKVWSLQVDDDWHRIWVPEAEQYGWVPAASLADFEAALIQKGRDKLNEKLKGQPAAVEACFAAFAQGRPEGGFEDAAQGVETIEQSLATIDSHYDDSNPLTALLYEDLLNLYQQTGQFDRQFQVADRRLSQFLFAHGFAHPASAVVRSVCADQYRAAGNYAEEASERNEILETCQKRFGPDDPRTQMQQIGLATNHVRQGRFQQATELYEEVLQQAAEEDRPSFVSATARLGLGGLLASERRCSAARRQLRQAADGFQALNVPVPALMAQSLHLLGWCHGELGEYDEAVELLQQAETFAAGPSNEMLRQSILTWKARLAAQLGSEQAVPFATAAVEFAEQTFEQNSVPLLGAWQALGIAEQFSDRRPPVTAFDKARRLAHDYAQQVVAFQRPGRQISYAAEDRKRLNEALSRTLIEQDPATATTTATWWVNSHEQLAEQLAVPRRTLGQITSERDQLNFRLWTSRRNLKARLPWKLQGSRIPRALQQTVEEIQTQEQRLFDDLPDNIQRSLSAGRDWIEIDQVRRRLRTGEVLIAYQQISEQALPDDIVPAELTGDGADHLWVAWMIPAPQAGEIQLIEVGWTGPTELLVNQTLDLLTDIAAESLSESAARKAYQQERDQLERLSRQLWQPVADRLPEGTTHLTFCPDGVLNSIPWAALSHKNGELVIDSCTVRCLLNPRDLLRDDANLELSPPLVMTDPEWIGQDAALTDLPKEQQEFLARRTEGSRFHLDKAELRDAIDAEPDLAGDILDLIGERARITAGQRKEKAAQRQLLMEACTAAFGDDTVVAENVEASEYRFFTAVRPRFLHINAATFAAEPRQVEMTGVFASAESRVLIPSGQARLFSPLMQCGVLLSGFGLDKAKHHLNDGVLTGEEVVSQDLRGTELVTLSVAPRGPDGSRARNQAAALLPQTFLLAGAEAVVSASWPQSKQSTQAFLEIFYRQLAAGKDKAEALRAAQLETRDSGQFLPAAYWAGFQLTGKGWETSGSAAAPEQDTSGRSDSEETVRRLALKVLQLYRKKDIEGLLALSPDGQPTADVLKSFAPGTSRYNSLFGASSWRWQAVTAWDGELAGVHYMRNRQSSSVGEANMALVEFGRSDSEVFVVTLVKQDDSWAFDDLHSPGVDDLPEP